MSELKSHLYNVNWFCVNRPATAWIIISSYLINPFSWKSIMMSVFIIIWDRPCSLQFIVTRNIFYNFILKRKGKICETTLEIPLQFYMLIFKSYNLISLERSFSVRKKRKHGMLSNIIFFKKGENILSFVSKIAAIRHIKRNDKRFPELISI